MKTLVIAASFCIFYATQSFALTDQEIIQTIVDQANVCKKRLGTNWIKRAKCFEQVENTYMPKVYPYSDVLRQFQSERMRLAIAATNGEISRKQLEEMAGVNSQSFQAETANRLQRESAERQEAVRAAMTGFFYGVISTTVEGATRGAIRLR